MPLVNRLALRFRIAGIPVQVDPSFWVMSLLLGMAFTGRGMLIWIPSVFVSVLVHEMGHALMARAVGAKPEITLYMMGGVTRSVYDKDRPVSRFKSALVTMAGPGAGFILAGIAFVALVALHPTDESMAVQVIGLAMYINLIWGAANLLPVLPLDGGNLLRAALSGPGPEVGLVRTLWVSALVGPVVAFLAWKHGYTWGALLMGMFTFSAVRQLMDMSRSRADRGEGLDEALEQAQQALMDGDLERAEHLAGDVAKRAKTKALRLTASHLLAFIRIEKGEPQSALDTLERLAPDDVDPFLLGACLLALDRPAEAVVPLERAAQMGRQPQAIHLLLQALERSGDRARANEVRKAVEAASAD